jgi:hypothetical protein
MGQPRRERRWAVALTTEDGFRRLPTLGCHTWLTLGKEMEPFSQRIAIWRGTSRDRRHAPWS